MGISVVEELAARGDIDETSLGARFAARYAAEPWRGVPPLGAYFAYDLDRAASVARKSALIERVWVHTPRDSATRDGIQAALALPLTTPIADAAARLGNGSRELAADTVPLLRGRRWRHGHDVRDRRRHPRRRRRRHPCGLARSPRAAAGDRLTSVSATARTPRGVAIELIEIVHESVALGT